MFACLILSALVALGVAKVVLHRRLCHAGLGTRWTRHHHHPFGARGGSFFRDELGLGGFAPGVPWAHGADRRTPPFLWTIMDRLGVTPAQERALRGAWDELRAEIGELRDEGRRSREDVAEALRRPSLDESLLGELFARHDTGLERARKAFVGFLARAHDALDEGQRRRLAELLERGAGPLGVW